MDFYPRLHCIDADRTQLHSWPTNSLCVCPMARRPRFPNDLHDVIGTLKSLLQFTVRSGVLHRLTTWHDTSTISLFAYDMVIFYHPDPSPKLAAIRELLRVFETASGLCPNFPKCSVTPTRCSPELYEAIGVALACLVTSFPI